MEKSVDVQICLVKLELSQDAYGIPRFLWNNTVVFLIIMPQNRLVLPFIMKKSLSSYNFYFNRIDLNSFIFY